MGYVKNSGGIGNLAELFSGMIPTPKIEVLKVEKGEIVSVQVYSDLQNYQSFLAYNPKIILLRYKTKRRSRKYRNEVIGQEEIIIPARWAFPLDNTLDGTPKKTTIFEVDTTNSTQIQVVPKAELRRNGATKINIKLNEWFKTIEVRNNTTGAFIENIKVSNQANYSVVYRGGQ
ncbi:MAG: hypothetical protein SFU27_02605 [Thermonemataceae bacterium]|nr:hypothetical protein [Thermonemataceae bacterium]